MKCDGVLFLTVFTLLCAASLGYNNGYGMKPFLGWQSWCAGKVRLPTTTPHAISTCSIFHSISLSFLHTLLGGGFSITVGKCGTDLCHDQQIRDTAKALVDTGMKDLVTIALY